MPSRGTTAIVGQNLVMKNAFWLFIFSVVILVVFLPSYTKMQDLFQKNVDYQHQIQTFQVKNSQLHREKKMLEDDPVYLEKVAREKLGLIKQGEVVYRVNPDKR